MTAKKDVVIVGGGQAGFQLVGALRLAQYTGAIRLLCDEAHPPYQRPPLSKDFLRGVVDIPDLPFATEDFFGEQDIDRISAPVAAIDIAARQITVGGDRNLDYDQLVLATGARIRTLPGAEGIDGVIGLRTIDDAVRLRDQLQRGGAVVIVGAGFLGLEVASVCADLGVSVQVVEMQPRVMSRGVSATVASVFRTRLETKGVRFHLGVTQCQLRRDGSRLQGVDVNGNLLKCDLVLAAIGVVPNVEIAAAAGIACRNGILTNNRLQTDAAGVWAIGDCAAHPNLHLGRVMRLESVQNALDQANCAAQNICGAPTVYDSMPWFWTEQAGLKLQIIGNTETSDVDQLIQGDPGSGSFSVFHFRGDYLIGAESVNRPKDQILARKWLRLETRPTVTFVQGQFAPVV